MGKFLIGVFTGFALTVLVFVLIVVAALRVREKPTPVADGSTLILRLNGEIPELPPIEFPLPFLHGISPTCRTAMRSTTNRTSSATGFGRSP